MINPKTNKPYDETPPSINLKCIVFTILLALGYWYLPKKNKWILLILLYFPYLVLAWYDYYYDCGRNFGPTYLMHYYEFFKPKESRQRKLYDNWHPKYKRRVLIVDIIVLLGIIIIAPYFLKWKPKI
tara:strand:- start:248 stop:628 length:381 start_codon:yes stop_codon:yes gene_type:complete